METEIRIYVLKIRVVTDVHRRAWMHEIGKQNIEVEVLRRV